MKEMKEMKDMKDMNIDELVDTLMKCVRPDADMKSLLWLYVDAARRLEEREYDLNMNQIRETLERKRVRDQMGVIK